MKKIMLIIFFFIVLLALYSGGSFLKEEAKIKKVVWEQLVFKIK